MFFLDPGRVAVLHRIGCEEPMHSILVFLLSFKFKGFSLDLISQSLYSDIISDFQFEDEKTDSIKASLFILFYLKSYWIVFGGRLFFFSGGGWQPQRGNRFQVDRGQEPKDKDLNTAIWRGAGFFVCGFVNPVVGGSFCFSCCLFRGKTTAQIVQMPCAFRGRVDTVALWPSGPTLSVLHAVYPWTNEAACVIDMERQVSIEEGDVELWDSATCYVATRPSVVPSPFVRHSLFDWLVSN